MTHGDKRLLPQNPKTLPRIHWDVLWILGNFFWILILGRVFGFWEVFCSYEPPCLEIIRHLINMNEKIFLILSQKKNYLSHNKIVQQRFKKCSFQRVPNQVEKLRKFQGVGEGGMISTLWSGNSRGLGI